MSANKYANLPDIDTAPDIYETEDVAPLAQGPSSDDEGTHPTRSLMRNKPGDLNTNDSLDSSHLDTEAASKKFRKAERRRDHSRAYFNYPPSPTSPISPDLPSHSRPLPLSQRLRALQTELAALEIELADPTNPQLIKEREEDNVDPGELIRGLVDARSRLDRIRKNKEGRGKLVNIILTDNDSGPVIDSEVQKDSTGLADDQEVRSLAQLDRRVGEIEKLVGAASAAIDENSPLPPPLLPQISRLTTQITILTQPRHIDSVSRRLKLLLSDLDRAASSQHTHRRNPSQPSNTSHAHIQEQLLPLLARLGPTLPQIPHILMRLRTLSALHTAAGDFQHTVESLEEEQRKLREATGELETAVETVERNIEDNRSVIRGNVEGLEQRVDALFRRMDHMNRE